MPFVSTTTLVRTVEHLNRVSPEHPVTEQLRRDLLRALAKRSAKRSRGA